MSWDKYAPTSQSQLDRLSRLKAACGGEEVEAVVRRNQGSPTPIQKLGNSAKPAGIAALYKESYEGDGAPGGGVDELGEKARERGVQLREYVRTCQAFVGDVERAVHLLDTIAQQQEQVTSKTQALHATCESLLAEQKRLESQVEALSAPLQRFGALEELGPALGLPFASTGRGEGTGGGAAPARISVGGGSVEGARYEGGGSSVSSGGGGRGRVLLHPGSKEFAQALERANSAMNYLRQHPEFIEGSQYMDKYAQLLSRALALVKNQAVEYLEQAARLSLEKPVVEGRLETSEIYSRFRAVSHRVNAGVALMRQYVSSAPLIKTLLSDVRQLYFEKRLALLRPAVRSHLEAMSKQRGLTAMIRFGAAFLVRVGQLETQLYDACLGEENDDNPTASKGRDKSKRAVLASEGGDRGHLEEKEAVGGGEKLPDAEEEADMEEGRAGLYGMLLVLCSELHKNLRPRVYHGTDMDTLCELVSVIREEIVEEQRGRHGLSQVRMGGGVEGEAGAQGEAAIETVLMKLVQDSQERLIYMATKVIQDDIAGFRPSPEHLDYPGMLVQARGDPRDSSSSSDQALSGPGTPASSPPPGAAYTTWYPPLRSTLQVLSKVYRAVDMGVFEDLAQLAVAACAETMKRAAVAISTGVTVSSKAAAPPSSGGGGAEVGEAGEGGLDAQLFLIKHLLTLREQLTPFRIQFVRAEHKLNFGSTRMALRKFIRHTPALFRLSSKNALVELTLDSIPTIDEIQVDAKGDMEASLKSACSAFIACAVDLVASPLLSWASKVRAFDERGEEGMASLRAQPFASPARVKETVHAALFSAAAALPRVCAAMSLYLDNKATEGILLHPVQRRVVDTVDGVREVLHKIHPAEDLEEIMPLLAQVSQLALSAGEDNGPPPPSPSAKEPEEPEGKEITAEPAN